MDRNKKSYKKIQEKISKDIEEIRNDNEEANVNEVVIGIRRYYNSTSYDEEDLFYRISNLETRISIDDIMLGAGLGALLGFAIGFLTKDIYSFVSSNNPLYISLLSFVFGVMVSGAIIYTIRKHSSFKKGRNKYLDKKEVEIITSIIERSDERKYRRFRRTY